MYWYMYSSWYSCFMFEYKLKKYGSATLVMTEGLRDSCCRHDEFRRFDQIWRILQVHQHKLWGLCTGRNPKTNTKTCCHIYLHWKKLLCFWESVHSQKKISLKAHSRFLFNSSFRDRKHCCLPGCQHLKWPMLGKTNAKQSCHNFFILLWNALTAVVHLWNRELTLGFWWKGNMNAWWQLATQETTGRK